MTKPDAKSSLSDQQRRGLIVAYLRWRLRVAADRYSRVDSVLTRMDCHHQTAASLYRRGLLEKQPGGYRLAASARSLAHELWVSFRGAFAGDVLIRTLEKLLYADVKLPSGSAVW